MAYNRENETSKSSLFSLPFFSCSFDRLNIILTPIKSHSNRLKIGVIFLLFFLLMSAEFCNFEVIKLASFTLYFQTFRSNLTASFPAKSSRVLSTLLA